MVKNVSHCRSMKLLDHVEHRQIIDWANITHITEFLITVWAARESWCLWCLVAINLKKKSKNHNNASQPRRTDRENRHRKKRSFSCAKKNPIKIKNRDGSVSLIDNNSRCFQGRVGECATAEKNRVFFIIYFSQKANINLCWGEPSSRRRWIIKWSLCGERFWNIRNVSHHLKRWNVNFSHESHRSLCVDFEVSGGNYEDIMRGRWMIEI